MRLPPPPPPGRILGLFSGAFTANGYYRVVAPLSTHADATWAEYRDVTAAQLEAADVVLCARLGGDTAQTAQFIHDLQARGKMVVLDYDDDYFGEWPGVPPKDTAAREELVRSVAHAITLADMVVVPNGTLRAVFQACTDRLVVVHPNTVRPDWWTPPAPRAGPPIVGLFGSPSHDEDWRTLAAPLRRLRQMRPDTRIYCVGYLPDYLDGIATHYARWVTLREYMGHVNACDLLLAPLADTPFNHGKSPGRALEAGLARIPAIGSPTVYGDVLRAAGLPIACRPGEWFDAIARYLDDPALREAHGQALAALVRTQYDARTHAHPLSTIIPQEARYAAD